MSRQGRAIAEQRKGQLVVSLDFELFWGVRDYRTVDEYRERLMATRELIPELLKVFGEYEIGATWATVGFLFADGRDEALAIAPDVRPGYEESRYSPYWHLERRGESEREDPLHFAPSLIEQIRQTPGQEVGSHTYSHYFCLEPGQGLDAWQADLEAAHRMAERHEVELSSLVFPRNQFDDAYLRACRTIGFEAYRGNPDAWLYQAHRREGRTLVRRAGRLLDAHLPVAGSMTHPMRPFGSEETVDVPASRFLRPWTPASSPFSLLRRRRIRREMRQAARDGHCYHLWWHPHNFGAHPGENLTFLRSVLEDFSELRDETGIESVTMAEAASRTKSPTPLATWTER